MSNDQTTNNGQGVTGGSALDSIPMNTNTNPPANGPVMPAAGSKTTSADKPSQNQQKAVSKEKDGSTLVFLFRYRDQPFSEWKLHTSFLTEAQAEKHFKGQVNRFEKLTAKDLDKGFNPFEQK